MFSTELKAVFAERVLSWFGRHRQDLPWRRTYTPYQVWVPEVMAQQTQCFMLPKNVVWLPPHELTNFGFPAGHRKLIGHFLGVE